MAIKVKTLRVRTELLTFRGLCFDFDHSGLSDGAYDI